MTWRLRCTIGAIDKRNEERIREVKRAFQSGL